MRIFILMLMMLLTVCNIVEAPKEMTVSADSKIEPATKRTVLASRGGSSIAHDYIVTAYTAGQESTGKQPGDIGYGLTASGTHVTEGRTCACPPSLPIGTKIYIEDLGVRICEDRGSDIQGNRIDVYMEKLQDALRYGRRLAKVRLVHEKGSDSEEKASL